MPAEQAINDKLQGSVAAYLKCGGVVNNQIKKGSLLSLRVKKIEIGNYLAKLQAKTWLSRALSSSFISVLARRASCPVLVWRRRHVSCIMENVVLSHDGHKISEKGLTMLTVEGRTGGEVCCLRLLR